MFTSIVRFTLIAVLAVFISQCDGGSGGVIEVDTGSDTAGTDTGETSSIDAEITVDPADTSSDGGTTDGGTTDGGTTDGGTTDGGTTDGSDTGGDDGSAEVDQTDTATTTETSTETDTTADARTTDDDGDGYAEMDGDCNDADATINPGTKEGYFYGNGGHRNADHKDNDCDHRVDETYCACALIKGYVAPDGATVEEENIEIEEPVESTDTATATITTTTSTSTDTTTSGRGLQRRKSMPAMRRHGDDILRGRARICTMRLEELQALEYFDCVEKPESTGTDTTTTGSDTSGTTTGADTGTTDGSSTTGGDTGTTDGSSTTASDTGTTDGSSTTGSDTGTTDGSSTTGADTSIDTDSGKDGESASKDGEDSIASADTGDIDKYYFAWRGYTLNPDNKGTFGKVASSIGDRTGSWSGSTSLSVTATAKVDMGAISNRNDSDDDAFEWTLRYTGMAYDSSKMQVLTGYSKKVNLNGESSDSDTGDTIYVGEKFSDWFSGSVQWDDVFKNYKFYAALSGFDVDCSNYTINPESFYVRVEIDNGSHAQQEEDSNSNHHYVGSDWYLRPEVLVEMTEPDSNVDNCDITVKYDIIGIDVSVFGATWYDWDNGSGTGSSDAPRKDGVTLDFSVPGKGQAFVIQRSNGFAVGDKTDSVWNQRYWGILQTSSFIDSLSGASATISMYGQYTQYQGDTLDTTERPDALDGYIIYAKDDSYLVATEGSVSGDEPQGGDDSDSGTGTVTIDVPEETSSRTTGSSGASLGKTSSSSTSSSSSNKDGEDSDTSTSTSTTGGTTFSPSSLPAGGLEIKR